MLNQDICLLHDSIAVYSSYGGIVFAEEEGRNIARALGPKNKVCSFSVAPSFLNTDVTDRDPAQPWTPVDREHGRRSRLSLRPFG